MTGSAPVRRWSSLCGSPSSSSGRFSSKYSPVAPKVRHSSGLFLVVIFGDSLSLLIVWISVFNQNLKYFSLHSRTFCGTADFSLLHIFLYQLKAFVFFSFSVFFLHFTFYFLSIFQSLLPVFFSFSSSGPRHHNSELCPIVLKLYFNFMFMSYYTKNMRLILGSGTMGKESNQKYRKKSEKASQISGGDDEDESGGRRMTSVLFGFALTIYVFVTLAFFVWSLLNLFRFY